MVPCYKEQTNIISLLLLVILSFSLHHSFPASVCSQCFRLHIGPQASLRVKLCHHPRLVSLEKHQPPPGSLHGATPGGLVESVCMSVLERERTSWFHGSSSRSTPYCTDYILIYLGDVISECVCECVCVRQSLLCDITTSLTWCNSLLI